jgi:hypothetical protein
MNATGDGDEDLGPLAQGLPLSAPVAADMGQSRRVHPYLPHVSAPAPRAAQPGGDVPAAGYPAGYGRAAEYPAGYGRTHGYPAEDGPVAGPPPVTVPPPAPALSSPPPVHQGAGEPPEDPNRVILRKQLDALRVRAANASSWLETSGRYAQMINRDGLVRVTARFTREDIEFLGRAREEVLGLAELSLRLLDLHAPLDAGGISTDPSSPILRCRSCMWRWPCPTFGTLTEIVSQLPGPPPAR